MIKLVSQSRISKIERADPLLVLLAFQCFSLVLQVFVCFLPLTGKQLEWVTIIGAVNFVTALLNTTFFFRKLNDKGERHDQL